MQHLRLPGVLQRIGIGFWITASFMLLIYQRGNKGEHGYNSKLIGVAALFIVVSYWMLLYLVPVPGYGRLVSTRLTAGLR